MKKILFNSKFGLEQAVLEGRKTMTRRAICPKIWEKYCEYERGSAKGQQNLFGGFEDSLKYLIGLSPYKVGEVVAIAQSYSSIEREIEKEGWPLNIKDEFKKSKGWENKMFVRADGMPHHIEITNVRFERLQSISYEDCLKEGVYQIKSEDVPQINETGGIYYTFEGVSGIWTTPREAFTDLIDKTCGKGTWQSNPWVFAYSFKLID